MGTSLQHCADPACPGDPAAPEGTHPSHFKNGLGLVPHWAKDSSGAARAINARSETAAERPAFRDPLKLRRCLIPADGFHEWAQQVASKQPFCFEVREGELFAFAGLWDGWKGSNGNWVKTCSILTTRPNALTSAVHDRMPVILNPDSYDMWLDPGKQLGHASTAFTLDTYAHVLPHMQDEAAARVEAMLFRQIG